jgi:hypothetical protein
MMTPLEQNISKKIHEFDLVSLLQLLEFLGYQPEELHFKSHFSTSSQPSLIHQIEFYAEPSRMVVITLNLGLLSAQTPLPSYFLKKVDAGYIDTKSFVDFIGYFDHFLIRNYLLNIHLETNRALFSDWEVTKRRYLQMLDLKSCSTLHWLFELVFPELGVQVDKVSLKRQLRTAHLKLGETILGTDAILGEKTGVPVSGRRITLFSEFEITDSGEPWPREIKQRLDTLIFPIFRAVGMELEIILVIRAQKTWAVLQSDSYLGYDKIRGGGEQYRRIRIFSGRIKAY